MRHFRPLRPRDLRELQRIKSSQGKAGTAVGKGSEDFFKGVLIKLYQERKIKGFRKTRKWSFADYHRGIDFFIWGIDEKVHGINVKSSEAWLVKRKPDIIYIVVGLHPEEKEIVKQLRKYKIIL